MRAHSLENGKLVVSGLVEDVQKSVRILLLGNLFRVIIDPVIIPHTPLTQQSRVQCNTAGSCGILILQIAKSQQKDDEEDSQSIDLMLNIGSSGPWSLFPGERESQMTNILVINQCQG